MLAKFPELLIIGRTFKLPCQVANITPGKNILHRIQRWDHVEVLITSCRFSVELRFCGKIFNILPLNRMLPSSLATAPLNSLTKVDFSPRGVLDNRMNFARIQIKIHSFQGGLGVITDTVYFSSGRIGAGVVSNIIESNFFIRYTGFFL